MADERDRRPRCGSRRGSRGAGRAASARPPLHLPGLMRCWRYSVRTGMPRSLPIWATRPRCGFLAAGYADPHTVRRLGRARLARLFDRHSRGAFGESLADQILAAARASLDLWGEEISFPIWPKTSRWRPAWRCADRGDQGRRRTHRRPGRRTRPPRDHVLGPGRGRHHRSGHPGPTRRRQPVPVARRRSSVQRPDPLPGLLRCRRPPWRPHQARRRPAFTRHEIRNAGVTLHTWPQHLDAPTADILAEIDTLAAALADQANQQRTALQTDPHDR
jgi:hypothetical protein